MKRKKLNILAHQWWRDEGNYLADQSASLDRENKPLRTYTFNRVEHLITRGGKDAKRFMRCAMAQPEFSQVGGVSAVAIGLFEDYFYAHGAEALRGQALTLVDPAVLDELVDQLSPRIKSEISTLEAR